MLLKNLYCVSNNRYIDITFNEGRIVSNGYYSKSRMQFKNCIAFPGLINSHDHLDFNLFPNLGSGKYGNFTEWAEYIQKEYKDEIKNIISIPEKLRTKWGAYKNLINGVTTVVNHGKLVRINNLPVSICQESQSLHSVKYEKMWKLKLNAIWKIGRICSIHVGEGIDEQAASEINHLIKWNKLNRRIVAVHGIAMSVQQAKKFHSMVWCPASNHYLFGQTAPIDKLRHHIPVIFGTDSTLTSSWNMWDQLRMAMQTGMLDQRELFESVTIKAANVWKLNAGSLDHGRKADIVIATKKEDSGLSSFYSLGPEDILMVIQNGRLKLLDLKLAGLYGKSLEKNYSMVSINGAIKYIPADGARLIKDILTLNPEIDLPVKLI